jgi:hypothetical protein
MWIDSEEPMADIMEAWDHLKGGDNWDRPAGAEDVQVLLMTTCMETWIVADRASLRDYYGHKLQENALPPLNGLEARGRHDIHDRLVHATRNCKNAFTKGERSFDILEEIDPEVLKQHLPSFARVDGILNAKL